MVEKAKIFYFSVFVLVVFAFVFHINAMGHHHWKKATAKYASANLTNYTSIGLFTRCIPSEVNKTETCFPNMYPRSDTCFRWDSCISRSPDETCRCDFLPSTKGIASCAIIAAAFLGIAIIILFTHSIKTSETRSIGLFLGLLPLFSLLLAFIFILIALILVGSYLSRDIMHTLRFDQTFDLSELRQRAAVSYEIRVDWSTGLEIIALVFTFFSTVLYSLFVFKLGRSS